MDKKASPGKPGILVKGLPPDKADDYTLGLYFDRFGTGEDVVKQVTFSEDKTSAYVEFEDPSGEAGSIE